MGRKEKNIKEKKPAWKLAQSRVEQGVLGDLMWESYLFCDEDYPMAKDDWAFVTREGEIYLNPRKQGEAAEWEYVISHCLLHLGMDHFVEDRKSDPDWVPACDLVVTRFLQDTHIGRPPPEFARELPFSVKDEAQTCAILREHPEYKDGQMFSTMTRNRADMVWNGKPSEDYPDIFAKCLQDSIQAALRKSSLLQKTAVGIPNTRYHRAREWFISRYPLLGALAASFRIVDDGNTVRRMGIPVAAVNAQLQEIYINSNCRLRDSEWRFVLAHEFLHAALRHDVRVEDRDPILWNVACDYVVNAWLLEMRIGDKPEGVLYEQRFQGKSAEAVYDEICEDVRYYTSLNPMDLIYGDDKWWDSMEGAELDESIRSAIRQGLAWHMGGKERGYLPAGLVEEINAIAMPPIKWDVELAKWFDERFSVMEMHRTYTRVSRRQSSSPNIPRPAWRLDQEEENQRIYGVLLDTSGSMDRGLLSAALGSIASYSEARDVQHIRVVFCDAVAYDQGVMNPAEIAGSVRIRGRGGTKLQPGIDLLDADPSFPKEAPLLIITDGYIDNIRLHGREHAYLIPWGKRLPFSPKGPVFKIK